MLSATNKTITRIAILGDAQAKETDQHFKDAYETAKILAKNGFIIVNGGGPGVMLAASLGAVEGGTRPEVVLLDKEKATEEFEGECRENTKLADKIYTTQSIEKRTEKITDLADAFVVFKGGTGTIHEMGVVWSLAKLNYGNHEPVIFFGQEWKEIVKTMIKELDLEKIEQKVIEVAERPEEVLNLFQRLRPGVVLNR